MNITKLFRALCAASILLVSLSLVAAAQTPTDDTKSKNSDKAADITGAWLVNLSINGEANDSAASQRQTQPPSGAKTQAPFIAVETFHPDGTFTETSLTDLLPPAGPPGQGVWAKTGAREFALTFYGVTVGDLTNPQFQGTYKVRSKLTLSRAGEEFSGPFIVEIYDTTGALLFTLEGTAQGRRAHVDPLP